LEGDDASSSVFAGFFVVAVAAESELGMEGEVAGCVKLFLNKEFG
jgi:hypothetical protein